MRTFLFLLCLGVFSTQAFAIAGRVPTCEERQSVEKCAVIEKEQKRRLEEMREKHKPLTSEEGRIAVLFALHFVLLTFVRMRE
ncbi:MAG: hypothetical protein AAB507_00075 [Patescibacteria group bacterium]